MIEKGINAIHRAAQTAAYDHHIDRAIVGRGQCANDEPLLAEFIKINGLTFRSLDCRVCRASLADEDSPWFPCAGSVPDSSSLATGRSD